MYARLPAFVLGFHGCDASLAEAVFAGKKTLTASRNTYDWLGRGVYFWENSPARALEYAVELRDHPRRTRPRIKMPAVVGAVIDLGYCLNLMDAKFLKIVKDGYRSLERMTRAAGVEMPVNKTIGPRTDLLLRDLDCAVVNIVHQTRKEEGLPAFDSVRAAFIEGEPLYPGAGFHDRNHMQVCVHTAGCIKGYFRPRDNAAIQAIT